MVSEAWKLLYADRSDWANGRDISASLQYLGLIATALGLLLSTVYLLSFLTREPESAVAYEVEPPPQCSADWEGEQLNDPQVKVPVPLRS